MGYVFVDSVNQPQSIISRSWGSSSTDTGLQETVGNSYLVDLNPGTHLIELKGKLYDESGAGTAFGGHTGFSYMVVGRS